MIGSRSLTILCSQTFPTLTQRVRERRPCPTFNKLDISSGTHNPKVLKERKAGFSRGWYAGLMDYGSQ